MPAGRQVAAVHPAPKKFSGRSITAVHEAGGLVDGVRFPASRPNIVREDAAKRLRALRGESKGERCAGGAASPGVSEGETDSLPAGGQARSPMKAKIRSGKRIFAYALDFSPAIPTMEGHPGESLRPNAGKRQKGGRFEKAD